MALIGYATDLGTKRYRERVVDSAVTHNDHFRDGPDNLVLSSIGLGTYLGNHDGSTDSLYLAAIKEAVAAGCNVLDSAINYRCQRSERVIGRALAEMARDEIAARDELVISTKGGFIPFDGIPPRDPRAYLQKTFVMPGIIKTTDVVADCHCMTPGYLRNQLEVSLANLGISCIDVYYLHNPETQLDAVSPGEFLQRIRTAFEALEEAVSAGKLRVYGTATWTGFRCKSGTRGHLSLEALVHVAREVGGPNHHFKVIQVPYNLGMPEALAEQTQLVSGRAVSLLEAARALGIYVVSSATVLHGQLCRGLPDRLQTVLGEQTDAQRAIQFARSTPGLGTALIGMKRLEHVRENLAVARRAPLALSQFTTIFT